MSSQALPARHWKAIHHAFYSAVEHNPRQTRASWQIEVFAVRGHGLDGGKGKREWTPYATLFTSHDAATMARLIFSVLGVPARTRVHTIGPETSTADLERMAVEAAMRSRAAQRHAERQYEKPFLEVS